MSSVWNEMHLGVMAPLEHQRVVLRDMHIVGAVDDHHWRVVVLVEQVAQ
jgi:hypothetical protein